LTPKGFVAAATLLALTCVTPAAAQETGDGGPDPAKVRVRIGPLYMNPTIALANLGIDQNVFNEASDQNPKKDFTLTLVPNADLWLRMGRTWFTGAIKEEIVWYQKYTTERAANTMYSLSWKVPLNRLTANVGASYADVRDRPGFEIDARSRRKELQYNGSVEVRALSRTFLGVTASRQKVDFDKDAVFFNSFLNFELNRVTTTRGLSVRHQVTPLTSISLTATRSQDRFEFSSLRDSNSTSAVVTISFDPFALIKGSATFGYRDFEPVTPGLQNFNGATGTLELSYVLLGTTRFSVEGARDVQYSYDVNQPYYLQTGVTGSISHQLFGPVDVGARAGLQNLVYRDRAAANLHAANRADRVRTYGGGVGYRMGRDLRLGFNADTYRRASDLAQRRYKNLMMGISATYGF
jgi:Putative beta-barrel porin 2